MYDTKPDALGCVYHEGDPSTARLLGDMCLSSKPDHRGIFHSSHLRTLRQTSLMFLTSGAPSEEKLSKESQLLRFGLSLMNVMIQHGNF